MNIKRAKREIKNALRAYLAKDEFGAWRIPPIRQRPVLLIGPPGIGKTQIMQQIAEETGVGLVSYTLTHHTRESALWTAVYIEKVRLGGEGAHGDELHDERDHRIGLPRDRAHGRFRGHPVPRRDQLHLGDADADDAPVFAVQNVRQSAAPGQVWMVVAAGNPPEYE